mgnify:CR=1 FL=1
MEAFFENVLNGKVTAIPALTPGSGACVGVESSVVARLYNL